MRVTGMVSAVAGFLTVIGATVGLRRLGRFVAAWSSATGTATDSMGRWHTHGCGEDFGASRLSHPVVGFETDLAAIGRPCKLLPKSIRNKLNLIEVRADYC